MGKFDFDKSKIKLAKIEEVRPNTWNPKLGGTKEYEDVKKSLMKNGYVQPILVRQNDGYEIIDGQHRYLAAKELGYTEIYVYDCGEVSDEDAKAMTLWMQVQVPFDEVLLAPIALELDSLGMSLPIPDDKLEEFKKQADFDFDSEDEEPELDDEMGMKTLKVKVTNEQFELIKGKIKDVCELAQVSEGRALELITGNYKGGVDA